MGKYELSGLLRRPSVPPGWFKAAGWILGADVVVSALCVLASLWLYKNAHHYFQEKKPGTFASVGVLIAAGVVCFQIRAILRGNPLARFWLAFGVLMCLAGADDLLQLHERADRLIHYLLGRDPTDPITDHLDDVLVLAYILPAAWLGLKHFQTLVQATLMVQTLAVAAAVFVVHIGFDVFGWSRAGEEIIKQTAGCLILLAFLAVKFDRDLLTRWSTSAPGFGVNPSGE